MSSIQKVRASVFRNVGSRHKWEGFNLEQWLSNYISLFLCDIEGEDTEGEIVNELGREYAESLYEQWQGYPFGSDEDDDEHSLAFIALCQLFFNELRVKA